MNKNAPLSSQVKNILRARPTQLLFARVIIASCAFVTLPVTLSKQGRGRMCRKVNLEDSYGSSFLPLLILSNSHFGGVTEQKTFPKRCHPNRIFKTWDCFSKGQTCISQLNYIGVQKSPSESAKVRKETWLLFSPTQPTPQISTRTTLQYFALLFSKPLFKQRFPRLSKGLNIY